MSWLSLKDISHSYSGKKILDNLSLEVDKGEVVCLLGPSGCGKSTILRLIAGLENCDSGEIKINNKKVSASNVFVPPEKRKVGMVFQNPSLFPHLNVEKNISFGMLKASKKIKEKTVTKLLKKISLQGFEEKYPAEMSGGEQQRVALARSLAVKPNIMLLDEPFANLDSLLRRKIRGEVAYMLKDMNVASLMVTHDPEEALSIADRIYVMQSGKIIQFGTPKDLYFAPKNKFVAEIFGELNELDVIVKNNKVDTIFGEIDASKAACSNIGKIECEKIDDGVRVKIYIRPEALHIADSGVNAEIISTHFFGIHSLIYARLSDGDVVKIRVAGDDILKIGDKICLKLDERKIFIF